MYAQTDISGTWEVTFESPQGPATIEVTFKQVGESVDGSVTTPLGPVDFTGALIDDALTMSSKLDLQGNKLDIAMKAKVSGDTMAGSLVVGGLGEIPWTAKRKSAVAGSTGTATAPEAAATVDVSGRWDIAMVMRGGATFATIATLKQAGEQITGSLNGQAGDEPVTGTMVGKALTLQFRAATAQGDVAITMRGELGPDGFSGKLGLPGVGEIDWTGRRTK
jgi:peptidoglycan hydrolase-like protein with peptidoglycan-binding domain